MQDVLNLTFTVLSYDTSWQWHLALEAYTHACPELDTPSYQVLETP